MSKAFELHIEENQGLRGSPESQSEDKRSTEEEAGESKSHCLKTPPATTQRLMGDLGHCPISMPKDTVGGGGVWAPGRELD